MQKAIQRRRRPKSSNRDTRAAEPYASRAIHRAFDVLEGFEDEHASLGLREISAKLGLPGSSLYRILQTLEARGYLSQTADGTYRLTARVLYGKARHQAEKVRDAAKPHLQRLAMRFNETASLSHLFEERIQVIDTVETFHSMRLTNRPGRVLPPHCSSMGKSITAFQAPERIDRILEVYGLFKRGPNSIVDRPALLDEFARIRSRGYATEREESAAGAFCVGAPVRRNGKPVMSAIGISIPLLRTRRRRSRR